METNSEKYLEKLGLNISKIRNDKGLSQYKLAKILFMEQSNLARIEQGKTNPTVKSLLKISDALDVDVKMLFV